MLAPKLIELPYTSDSSSLFEKMKHLPWAVFLDSSWPYNNQGRYDILAADPFITLLTHGAVTTITTPERVTYSQSDPFFLVKELLLTYRPANLENSSLPFQGGAIGYFGYDLARRLESLPNISKLDIPMADMAIGIYAWAIIIDHHEQRCYLIQNGSHNTNPEQLNNILALLQQTPTSASLEFNQLSPWQANFSQSSYRAAFYQIQEYLHKGDCYQVNLAQRFHTQLGGSPWALYKRLRAVNPARYAAFLQTPEACVLSLSPERFLQVTNKIVTTQPIKGTRPRSQVATEDAQLALSLTSSAKDQAENLMIVDLLRNDLSKSCILGSIQVPQLFTLESLASVHHLVSTITGVLAADKDSLDLLRDCFPGGSITGAPKVRAMEIIEELEPQRRNLYCGSIAYISFHGNLDSNIAIRTLLYRNQDLYCYAGGGITADSDCAAEYAETLAKVAKIFKVLPQCAF